MRTHKHVAGVFSPKHHNELLDADNLRALVNGEQFDWWHDKHTPDVH